MNAQERREWEDDLRIAGWERVDGWWVHPHVGGLHNLASAIATFQRWLER